MLIHTKVLTVARLGCVIRAARIYHGFTLRYVADHAGVTVSRLHHWEKGKAAPSFAHMQALCAILRLDPGFLFRPTRDRFIDPTYALTSVKAEEDTDNLKIVLRTRLPHVGEQARRDAFFTAVGLNTDAQEREAEEFRKRMGPSSLMTSPTRK